MAGCTSSGGGPTPSASTTSTASGTSTSATSGDPSPSETATTSTVPSGSTTPAPGSPTAGTVACTSLTTSAQRTPGATGRSFALLTFTNSGSGACTVTGRPEVVLLDGNRQPVTQPAVDGSGSADAVLLAAGASASTLLVDDASTCTADSRSVYVRVTPPGGGASQDLPVALPPCSLSVKAVVAGTDPTP